MSISTVGRCCSKRSIYGIINRCPILPPVTTVSSITTSCRKVLSCEKDDNSIQQVWCKYNTNSNKKNNTCSQHQYSTRRLYHVTHRKEIIPLIAIGAIAILGRYSYRAMQRMDDEWDDYQYQLQQYEQSLVRDLHNDENDNNNDYAKAKVTSTIAIDFGTIYTKLAANKPTVQIMIDNTGERSFFNGVIYEDNTYQQCIGRGKAALERLHYQTNQNQYQNQQQYKPVVLPFHMIATTGMGTTDDRTTISKIVTDSITINVQDAIDRIRSSSSSSSVSVDNEQQHSTVRKVLTIPVSMLHQSNYYKSLFDPTLNNDSNNNNKSDEQVTIVPEPIAAIWGAQMKNILPTTSTTTNSSSGSGTLRSTKSTITTTIIIDIGGYVTQLAVVQNDTKIIHTQTIPWGGETIIEVAIQQLMKNDPRTNNNNNSNNDTDDMYRIASALQYHSRMAVKELSSIRKVRTTIHIPYLFPQYKDNQHYESELSRTVLQQAINDDIRDNLLPHYYYSSDSSSSSSSSLDQGGILSPHLPPPTDMTSLWVSVLTELLEQSQLVPTSIQHIMIIGGGSKFPPVIESIQNSLHTIMGPTLLSSSSSSSNLLVIPDISVRSELVALGAASLLPSYEYSIVNEKLIRRSDI